MVEATKTASEIEQDAEAAKRPSGTKIELNITKPKSLSEQPKPTISPGNEVFSNTPDVGLDPIDRGEAPLSEKITDSVGILDEPDMVVTDSAGVFDFEGEDHDQMDIMVQGTPVRIKKVEPETDYAKALKYGFANSALGLAINGEIPKPMELQFGEEVVSSLGAVVGDLPTFLTGFFVGGGPLFPVTGMGGGFAATEGIKQVLRDSIEKGEINTAGEWWERFKGATEEAGKGYAIGAVTGGAGKAVKTATEMAEASLLAKQAAPFLAEVSAMTTTSAAIEGREPTAREFAVAAVALGAMKGAAKGAGELASTVKKLKEIYAETGTHPSKVTLERLMAPISNERGGVEFGRGDFEALKKDIESRGIELDLFEDDARITLSKIVIPKKSRGQGIGSDVLAKIKEYADSTGKDIVLTPSKTFGATSVKRLEAFYKRQGFRENKGRNKDFGTRERFIYKPNPLLNERGGGQFFRDEPLEGKEEFSQEAADVKRVNDMYRRAEAKKKETLGEQAAKVKRHFNRLFIDRTVNFKDEMKAVFGEEDAAPLIQRYVLSSGWHGNAKLILDRAKSKIDKGLSRDEMLELDKIIASRRTIEIDLNKAAERARAQDAISEAKQTRDLIRKGINDRLNAKRKPHDDRIQKLIEIRLRMEKEQEGKEKRTREEISKLSKVKKGIEEAGKAIRKLEKEAGKELEERSGPIEAVIENLATRYNNIGNMRHPEGLTMKEHQAYLDSIPSKTRAKLFPRADEYANVMREQLIELHKEGLLTDQAYQAIAKKGEFYSLRQYLEAIDPEEEISLRGQSKKVMGSGLHRLDEGSLELMENDHTLLLEEVVARTQRRVFANRAAQELHKLAIKSSDPSQEILSTILKVAEEGEEIPPGYAELHAMVNGERKTIWMREDLAKEYIDEPLINRQNVLRVLEWLTLARPLKISATGWNPEFFITNLPRDMMLMWGATNQYSSIGPIAMAQMVKDMITVAPDLAFKKGRYEKAAQDGMLQDLLTTQGKPINIKGPWKAIAEAVAWPGEFTETLTRMAVRERAIKNGMTPEEAAFEARNVLDYQQSGHAAQVAEVGSPYIKAAIAGTRAVVRYAKENPGKFAWKMAQLGSFSAGLYYYNTVLSGMPEAYDAIPTTDKAKFFNILVPSMAQTDENGNVRVPYIRIAKDQGQQMFTPLFDSMMALKLNRDFDYEQLVEAFHGGMPVTEQSAFGPMASMVSSLYNYSLFFRDNIWKKQPVELWAEYDSRTNPLAYKLGQMTSYVDDVTGERKSLPVIGVSPKRLEVAVGSVIAQSHPLAPMVGETMRAVMDEVPDAKKREIYEKWNSIPGLRRLVKWTKPYNPQALKDIEKAKVSENTEKKITDDELKALFKGRDMSDIERNKNITEFIKEKIAKKKGPGKLKEMNRLKGNVLFMKKMEKIGGVPNKAFWYELRGLTDPETKADAYYRVWRKQTPEMQKRYDELLPRLNITSQKDFVVFYSKLKQLKKEKPK